MQKRPQFVVASGSSKVGFAAIQEMAKKQEQELRKLDDEEQRMIINKRQNDDLAFLRFDAADINCLQFGDNDDDVDNNEPGKFPLDIITPGNSPPPAKGPALSSSVGLKRFGSFRYYFTVCFLLHY